MSGPLEILASSIRAAVKAPPGRKLVVADLSSIESVGAAWLAGCDKVLDIFHEGRDTYKTFAAEAEGIPYDEVTKAQRTHYKPAVLGGAYMLSGAGLVDYAAGMGVNLEREKADDQIRHLRESWHEIRHYWWQLSNAAMSAVQRPGTAFHAKAVSGWTDTYDELGRLERAYTYKDWPKVSYWYDGTFLFCRLPSGRPLAYYKPAVDSVDITSRDGKPIHIRRALHYWGNDQRRGGIWSFINVHGGGLLENINQAMCRDILWHGLELAEEDKGLEVLGDVYDEAICETDEKDETALERLTDYLTRHPPWLDGRFYLAADGYEAKRYRKD